MKKVELVELGLDEEQIKEVFKLNGIAIENIKAQKSLVDEELQEVKLNNSELNNKINLLESNQVDLDNLSKTNEELKLKLSTKDEEIEAIRNEEQDKLNKFTYDTLLDKALIEAGAKSLEMAKAVINLEDIKLVDGKLDGIEEVLSKITKDEKYSHNFGDNTVNSSKLKITKASVGNNKIADSRTISDMSYKELLELKANDPVKYDTLLKK